jgi:hypothetical protein
MPLHLLFGGYYGYQSLDDINQPNLIQRLGHSINNINPSTHQPINPHQWSLSTSKRKGDEYEGDANCRHSESAQTHLIAGSI